MHIKVFTKAKCFAMHMMTWQVLVFKTPGVLQSVTVEDASLLLDHSGCRILPSGSMPEGKWRCPQHCKTNVSAYNSGVTRRAV